MKPLTYSRPKRLLEAGGIIVITARLFAVVELTRKGSEKRCPGVILEVWKLRITDISLWAQDLTTSIDSVTIYQSPRTPSLLICQNRSNLSQIKQEIVLVPLFQPCVSIMFNQGFLSTFPDPRIIDQRKENKNCIEDIPNIKPKMTASVSISWIKRKGK